MTDAPPMSGADLPLKELKIEEKPKEEVKRKKAQKREKKIYLGFILLLIFFFIGGISLGFYLKQKNDQVLVPSPSPSPLVKPSPTISPSPSPEAHGLQTRLNVFEKKLKEIDLKEKSLLPPVLDFKIRFKTD